MTKAEWVAQCGEWAGVFSGERHYYPPAPLTCKIAVQSSARADQTVNSNPFQPLPKLRPRTLHHWNGFRTRPRDDFNKQLRSRGGGGRAGRADCEHSKRQQANHGSRSAQVQLRTASNVRCQSRILYKGQTLRLRQVLRSPCVSHIHHWHDNVDGAYEFWYYDDLCETRVVFGK